MKKIINLSIGHYCYGCGKYVRYDPCENCGR